MNYKKLNISKFVTILAVTLMLVGSIAFPTTIAQAQTYPVVKLIAPQGTINTNQPEFSWFASSHPGATAYDIRMMLPSGEITQDRYTLNQMRLENGVMYLNTGKTYSPGEYLWKIRYRLWGDTYSDYSAHFAFTVPTTINATPIPQPSSTALPTTAPTNVPSQKQLVNVALKRTTTQSSNFSNVFGVGESARAVDGNTDGVYGNRTTTHTLNNAEAWWQVDLGAVQSISEIRLWNRTDCCGDRLSNLYVLVSDAPFNSTSLNAARAQSGVTSYYVNGQAGRPTKLSINRNGRYVRVQLTGTNYLSLSEVEVMSEGTSVPQPPQNPTTVPPTSTAVAPIATSQPSTNPVTLVSPAGVISTNQIEFVFTAPNHPGATLFDLRMMWPSGEITEERYRLDQLRAEGGKLYLNTGKTYPQGEYLWKIRYNLTTDSFGEYSQHTAFTVPASTPGTAANLALNKTATQSSNYDSVAGLAGRAVDGNTNGIFANQSVTHTGNNAQAWWQVDLGAVQAISQIRIWNRTDCCGSRLSNFYVLVSDAPFNSTNLNTARAQSGVTSYNVNGQAGLPTSLTINRSGRYVRVQLTGTNYLSLAEVQVLGNGTIDESPVQPTTAPTKAPTTAPTTAPTSGPTQQAPVSGAFYVATNGNDSNNGSLNAPWRTIQYAVNRLNAGQTLYLRGGQYRETVSISRSGTSGSPIKILAYPGETPILDGNNYQIPSSEWGAMLKISGNYIQMSGLEVRYSNWIAVVATGDYVVISHFNVHHNKENGIIVQGDNDIVENSSVWMNCTSNEGGKQTRTGWASGLSAARRPNNAIIRNNRVYQNWGEGLSTYEANGTVIEGNIVYDNWATNTYISDATNVLFQRNIIYATAGSVVNSGARTGIMMGDERYNPGSSNIRILNNIVFGAYRNLYWWQGTQGGGMNNVLIANNTFVNSRTGVNVQINSGSHQSVRINNNIIVQEDSLSIASINGSGISLSNNLWSKSPGSTALGSNSLVTDPRFAKVGSQTSCGYYHLLSGSPAIDRGLNLAEVTVDHDRESRSNTNDIGADEFR